MLLVVFDLCVECSLKSKRRSSGMAKKAAVKDKRTLEGMKSKRRSRVNERRAWNERDSKGTYKLLVWMCRNHSSEEALVSVK